MLHGRRMSTEPLQVPAEVQPGDEVAERRRKRKLASASDAENECAA